MCIIDCHKLAVAYDKLGDRVNAARRCRQVVELDPDFQPAADLLEKLGGN